MSKPRSHKTGHWVWVLLGATLGCIFSPALAHAQDSVYFAQQHYAQGKKLYLEKEYATALQSFSRSLAVYASPNTRLYAARCLRELGRPAEALVEYERTAREARERAAQDPRYVDTVAAAVLEGNPLRPRVGRIVLALPRIPPGFVLRFDRLPIHGAADGMSVPAAPGLVRVTAAAPGFLPSTQQTQVVAQNEVHLRIELLPAPPPPDPRRTVRWVSAPLAAAGLLAFTGGWIWTGHQYHVLKAGCGEAGCPDSQAEVVRGQRTQTGTQIALGVGVAAAVVTVLTYLWPRPPVRPVEVVSEALP